jgi:osmotically-inducible protein OsmY
MSMLLRPLAAAALSLAAMSAAAQTVYTYVLPTAALVAPMSDDDMEYTVARAIAADDSLKGAKLTLRIVEHRVLLEGTARTEAQAKQARAVAENAIPPEFVDAQVLVSSK